MSMSIRTILLLNATMMFIFSSIFFIIAGVIKKIYEDKTKTFQGEVEGEVLEVIKSGKDGVVGKLFATFVVYQYKINDHKYIVRPYSFRKNSAINQRYFDSENVTCIIYRGNHGGASQTKYHVGEIITVKYDLKNPKRHEILNNKDKMFSYKAFKIAGSLIMIVPLILVIISFFVKG